MSVQKLFVCVRVTLFSRHILWRGSNVSILPEVTSIKYPTLPRVWITPLSTRCQAENFNCVSRTMNYDSRNLFCPKLDEDSYFSRSSVYLQCRYMAGHSHWDNIKHFKSRMDFLKSVKYQKHVHDLLVCAKEHGADPKKNTKLAKLISEAKRKSVPNEVIERALRKATTSLSEKVHLLEGKGPSGSSLLFEVRCEKPVEAKGVIHNTLTRTFGTEGLQSRGSSVNAFDHKGIINVFLMEDTVDMDRYLEVAIDVGAEEVTKEKDNEGNSFLEFVCDPADLEVVKSKLEKHNISVGYADKHHFPLSLIKITPEEKRNLLKVIRKFKSFSTQFELESVTTNIEDFDPDEEFL